MYNCELFSVKKNKGDFQSAREMEERLDVLLCEYNINVKYHTDINPHPEKINDALTTSLMLSNAPDLYIFLNALDTSDSSSFKELFYEFISSQESELQKSADRKDEVRKIKIFSMGDLGQGYRGYCFKIYEKRFIVLPCASLTDKNLLDLVGESLTKAFGIFEEKKEEYPDGIDCVSDAAVVKKKEGFFRSLIPHKGDSKNVKARKVIVLVAIVAFVVALGYVINFFILEPARSNSINSELREIAYGTPDSSTEKEKHPEQDWEALKKINKEIVGWIKIKDTHIDYPVLEHKGDDQNGQYYLYRNYKKEDDSYGSVFVDYRSTKSVKSRNVILHGHNIQTGVFFHDLVKYGDLEGDLDFYRKHPIITFNTPEEDAKWKIISVIKTSTLYEHGYFFNYMQGAFTSDAEFMNFVYNLRVRSLFDIPVMVNEDDQILTLSTCSYEFTGFRTVIVARKVRKGEDENVDVQLAKKNPSPLFPDVYYQRYGGTRPDDLTFKTANEQGLVSWYDGKGDLKGDEMLTGTVAANPTEAPTAKNGEKSTVPENVTYYTVNYLDGDGSIMESYTVKEGDAAPAAKGTPTMAEDANYTYTFKEWNTVGIDMKHVKYSMNIAPNFTSHPK